jgi:hypothetical protein
MGWVKDVTKSSLICEGFFFKVYLGEREGGKSKTLGPQTMDDAENRPFNFVGYQWTIQ